MVDILGLATALRAATTIIKFVFVFVFETVCSQLAAMDEPKESESAFDLKAKMFVRALAHQGKIQIDSGDMQVAVFAMLKQALKTDSKKTVPAVAGFGKQKLARGKNRQSNPGGASEGINAFFATAQGADYHGTQKGEKGGKGKGPGGLGINPNKPHGSCGRCWKPGHFARDCNADAPHPEASDQRSLAQIKEVWAGRAHHGGGRDECRGGGR